MSGDKRAVGLGYQSGWCGLESVVRCSVVSMLVPMYSVLWMLVTSSRSEKISRMPRGKYSAACGVVNWQRTLGTPFFPRDSGRGPRRCNGVSVQCSVRDRPPFFFLLHLNFGRVLKFLLHQSWEPQQLQSVRWLSTDRSPDISNLRFFLAPDGEMICVGTSIERAVVSHDRFSCARRSRLWQIPDAGERRDESR